MRRLTPDIGLILCVVTLAVVYLWADFRLPASNLGDPLGPRVFPALIGAGMLVSALLMLFEVVAKARAQARDSAEATRERAGAADDEPRVPATVLLGMLAWTAIYYVSLDHAGYLLATLVFLLGLLSYFNRGRHVMNAIVAITFTVVVYSLFTYALGTPMPEGWLSF